MREQINEIESFLGYTSQKNNSFNYCMIAGQFSSGKSKFINNMLGFMCLPVGSIETTNAPTFINKGDNYVEIEYADHIEKDNIENAVKYKKGKYDFTKMNLYIDNAELNENITIIDMPGVNSSNTKFEEQFHEVLNKSQVVLYFLGKQMSMVDVKYLDKICDNGRKVIIVRTKMDCIKASEESTDEVIKEERNLYNQIYPCADTYFISLENDFKGNEYEKLKDYVIHNMISDAEKIKMNQAEMYIQKELKKELLKQKQDIMYCIQNSEGQSVKNDRALVRINRKKIRSIRSRLEKAESKIYDCIKTAKENYTLNGLRYISNKFIEGNVTKLLINNFVKKQITELQQWYQICIEEVISDINSEYNIDFSISDNNGKVIIPLFDIENIIEIFENKNSNFFTQYIFYYDKNDYDLFDNNEVSSETELKSYYEKILSKVFQRINCNFDNYYNEQIKQIISEYEKYLERELKTMEQFCCDKKYYNLKLNEIDRYLGVIEEYAH